MSRAALRSAAAYAIEERRRWAHSTVDEHCVARAVAYQDMSGHLIRLIDQLDATPPATTRAPSSDMPVGTPVLAFLDRRHGRALVTRTRSEVATGALGIPIVLVDGHAGPVALTHIEVLP